VETAFFGGEEGAEGRKTREKRTCEAKFTAFFDILWLISWPANSPQPI
jgi:hypothetical protein